MASPQVENGYTKIANEILEVMAQTGVNATQFRIIMVVWRYTYGFNRKCHELGERFIARATGIHFKQIQREINDLISKNIVAVIKDASFQSARVLKFNKDYSSWQVANKLPGNGLDTHTGSGLATSPGSGLATQEINIKENIKEIIMSPEEAEYMAELKKVTNYPWDIKKDLELFNTLKARYPDVDIMAVVQDWRIHKLSDPLKPKSNPRGQINTFCKNAHKWGKNRKETDNADFYQQNDYTG